MFWLQEEKSTREQLEVKAQQLTEEQTIAKA
jgi:hypothetical protein